MELEIFTLCDFAQDNKGKLTIVGTFNTIKIHNFPNLAPDMTLVVKMRFLNDSSKKHTIKIQMVQEKNSTDIIKPIESVFGASNATGDFYISTFIYKLNMVMFKEPGRYNIVLSVDEEKYTYPLFVNNDSN